MSGAVPQSLAFLIAFWINGLLHGIYITLFLRWLFLYKGSSSIYFVTLCWLCFVSANINYAINLYLLVEGFWFWLPKGGPDAFFANLTNWPTILREFNYQVLVSICDAFMVYRLWLIWDRNWYITILPSVLLICETAFGLMAASCLALQSNILQTAVNTFLAFNTAVQVVITVFTSARLLDPRQMKFLPSMQRARRFQLVRCIVESGLIVTTVLLLDIAVFVQGIEFHWVFNISLTHLYAITTVLIVLRMHSVTKKSPSRSAHGIPSNSYELRSHPDFPRGGNLDSRPVALNFLNSTSEQKPPNSRLDMPNDEVSTVNIGTKRLEPQDVQQNPQGVLVHVVREVY